MKELVEKSQQEIKQKIEDYMKLKIGGPCAVTFDDLLVRVDESFKLEVHIDTDEGNAVNLKPDTPCELVK